MKELNVTIRDLLRNYKAIIAKNQIVIISNHGKPEGVLVPYEQWKKDNETARKKDLKQMSIRAFLKGITFKGGDSNLSQNIDKILYDENFR